jgi:hypothetical protein
LLLVFGVEFSPCDGIDALGTKIVGAEGEGVMVECANGRLCGSGLNELSLHEDSPPSVLGKTDVSPSHVGTTVPVWSSALGRLPKWRDGITGVDWEPGVKRSGINMEEGSEAGAPLDVPLLVDGQVLCLL